MSIEDVKSTWEKPTVEKAILLPMEERPTMKISQEVMDQIWFLCNEVNKVEWSGTIFYKTNTTKDMNKLKIEVVSLLLLSIDTAGTTTYSEYKEERLIDFIMNNPGLKRGTIHSHHGMDVFFSGTDTDDLAINSIGSDEYLSVIVNNVGHIKAKMTKVGELTSSFKAHDLKFNINYGAKHALVYDILVERKFFPELKKTINEILSQKKVAAEAKKHVLPVGGHYKNNNQNYEAWKNQNNRDSVIADLFDDIHDITDDIIITKDEIDDDEIIEFIELADDFIRDNPAAKKDDLIGGVDYLFDMCFKTSIKKAPDTLVSQIIGACYQYRVPKLITALKDGGK